MSIKAPPPHSVPVPTPVVFVIKAMACKTSCHGLDEARSLPLVHHINHVKHVRHVRVRLADHQYGVMRKGSQDRRNPAAALPIQLLQHL